MTVRGGGRGGRRAGGGLRRGASPVNGLGRGGGHWGRGRSGVEKGGVGLPLAPPVKCCNG